MQGPWIWQTRFKVDKSNPTYYRVAHHEEWGPFQWGHTSATGSTVEAAMARARTQSLTTRVRTLLYAVGGVFLLNAIIAFLFGR